MRQASTTPTTAAADRFKILIIASLRYPIAQPFAGGLEAHTWSLAQGLRDRGHSVTVAGAVGSDPDVVGYEFGLLPTGDPSERPDITDHPLVRAAELAAFTGLMGQLHDGMLGSFDVIHNNAPHPYPIEQASMLPCPLVTTLHTPQLVWAERVLGSRRIPGADFVAVSRATAALWRPLINPTVVRNGIDTVTWHFGQGGDGAVWSGRIVPEKAPHLAIDLAAAAGLPLTIAGPVIDEAYFAEKIEPQLGNHVHYAGHLSQAPLAELVGSSALALVTPVWNEPFGMVAAEAMSCGTPVVAFARGGLPEIVDQLSGRLLPPVGAAGFTPKQLFDAVRAVREAMTLDRAVVRKRAVAHCSSATMLRGYERVYQDAIRRWDGP